MLLKPIRAFAILLLAAFILLQCATGAYAITPDIIIDNGQAGYVLAAGITWNTSTAGQSYGGNHVWPSTYVGAYAEITPSIPKSGNYKVSVWRPYVASPSARYMYADITYLGGACQVAYSMRDGTTGWHDLGVFEFAEGTSGKVKLSGGENVPRFDAVKFTEVDITPPQAQLTSPASMNDVPMNPSFTVTFTKAMNKSLLTPSNIGIKVKNTNEMVGVSVAPATDGKSVSVVPLQPLMALGVYELYLSSSLTDENGIPITGTLSWEFSVQADLNPPTAYIQIPADLNNAQPSTDIVIRFSEAVNSAALVKNGFSLTLRGKAVDYEFSAFPDGTGVTLDPVCLLKAGETYTVSIKNGMRDLAGNPLSGQSSWLIKVSSEAPADWQAPTATLAMPSARTGVALNTQIQIMFSEPMNKAKLNQANVKLSETESGNPVATSLTADSVGTSVTLTPVVSLNPGTFYSVTISSSVCDIAGNPLADNAGFIFRTQLPTEIISDYDIPGSGYSEVGTWANSSLKGYNNTSSRYVQSVPDPQNHYCVWAPTLYAGRYKVYLYLIPTGSVSTGVVTVTHKNGADTKNIDFRSITAPGWQLIGEYDFSSGNNGSIKLGMTVSDGSLRADAAKFEPVAETDTTQPAVSFASANTGFPLDGTIVLSFDRLMDTSTFKSAAVNLVSAEGRAQTAVTSQNGNKLLIKPLAPLKCNTVYTLSVTPDIKDILGNSVGGTLEWSFTTVPVNIGEPAVWFEDSGGMPAAYMIPGGKIKALVQSENYSQDDISLSLILVMYGPNGLVCDITQSPIDLPANSQGEAATQLTIPDNVSGLQCAAFLWNSVQGMDPFRGISTPSRAFTARLEESMGSTIEASGRITGASAGEIASFLVLYPGKSLADGLKASVAYISEQPVDSQGRFTFNLPVDNNAPGGLYTVLLGGRGVSSPRELKFYNVNPVTEAASLSRLNSAISSADSQALNTEILTYPIELGLQSSIHRIYSYINNKSYVLNGLMEHGRFDTRDSLSSLFSSLTALAAFNSLSDTDLNASLPVLSPIFGIATTDYGSLDKPLEALRLLINKRPLADGDKVKDAFASAVAVAAVNQSPSVNMKTVLERYKTQLGIDLNGAYSSLTSAQKTSFHQALAAYTFKWTDDFKRIFDEELDKAYSHQPSRGGGGGGGEGKSVSSITTSIPIPAPEPPKQLYYGFKDLDTVPWAKESIENLFERKILSGMGDGFFKPNETVTREQFVKMLILSFGLMQEGDADYTDVDKAGWYYPFIAAAAKAGIINGRSDGSFGIGLPVTREEMAALVYRAAKKSGVVFGENAEEINFTDAVDISAYAVEAVTALVKAGIINGVGGGRYEPQRGTTRAMAAKVLGDIVKLYDGMKGGSNQ